MQAPARLQRAPHLVERALDRRPLQVLEQVAREDGVERPRSNADRSSQRPTCAVTPAPRVPRQLGRRVERVARRRADVVDERAVARRPGPARRRPRARSAGGTGRSRPRRGRARDRACNATRSTCSRTRPSSAAAFVHDAAADDRQRARARRRCRAAATAVEVAAEHGEVGALADRDRAAVRSSNAA